ncbi:DUF560 domain-containing protein [Paraneptunicella aestuarii]|uniref:tetratricopeptide repeat protein n=1 Tax=Paraneptunicella aestuarii TaxID=2831148 RepID=UPI001E480818|nr:CDC27 family protein [Paraneptunicella aestuarii]UAA39874.1 DUF560 domain-containing protein [Paraneptunicella aestuarii]
MNNNKTVAVTPILNRVTRTQKTTLATFATTVISSLIFSFSFFSLSFSVQAASPSSKELLNLYTLIKQKQYSEAYTMSNALLEEYGGEAEFDFLAGQAAFQTGHFQEAVFAFERVMFNRPQHQKARLLLAFSYFKVDNYGAAKLELNQLLKKADTLTPEEQQKIRDYLKRIEEQERKAIRNTALEVKAGIGYDSNVNSGTDDDHVFLPALNREIPLVEGAQVEDIVADVALSYKLNEKLSQKSAYSLQANFTNITHDTKSNLDRSYLNLVANYSNYWNSTKYTVTGYIQPMMLDDQYYRTAYGVMLDGSWRLTDTWLWSVGTNAAKIDNNKYDVQSLDQIGINTKITYINNHIQMFELAYYDDDASNSGGEHFGRDYFTAAYTYLYPYSRDLNFTLKVYADKSKYDAIHPIYLVTRDDSSVTGMLAASYQLDDQWNLSAQLRHANKNSNIEIYAFVRSEVNISVAYKF